MEVFGAFLDQEWESLSNMFSFEDSDHHFLLASADIENAPEINGSNYYNINNNNSLFFPCHGAADHNTDQFYFAADRDISFRAADHGGGGDFFRDEKTEIAFEPMDFIVPSVFSDDGTADEILQLNAEMWREKLGNAAGSQSAENGDVSFVGMQLKRKLEAPDNLPESPKKSNKRNPRSKKSKKLEVQITSDGVETNNNGQSPRTCSSEEGVSNNELINGGGSSSPESKVSKSKGGKGPATDPQSIYARKRRERINERLKTLQTLVPNGTKVDISTMLEEAVDYVKFLQLQIKLLSSDDMWMFAPIAYNGMDMGLYQKICN